MQNVTCGPIQVTVDDGIMTAKQGSRVLYKNSISSVTTAEKVLRTELLKLLPLYVIRPNEGVSLEEADSAFPGWDTMYYLLLADALAEPGVQDGSKFSVYPQLLNAIVGGPIPFPSETGVA